jgi:hypothetical protein
MRGVVLTVVLAAALAGAGAGASSAGASDASSTHTYIQANYALAKAGVARIGAVQAKVQALNASLAQQCPDAGNGAPELEITQPISHEVVAALWSIVFNANAGSIATFISKVKHVHWSSVRITRVLTRYTKSLHELATLAMPNICEDVRAFASSGFRTVPAHVIALVEHAESVEIEPIPARLLAPFASGSDRGVLAKTTRLESKLEEQEFALGQSDWLEILGTLALPQ